MSTSMSLTQSTQSLQLALLSDPTTATSLPSRAGSWWRRAGPRGGAALRPIGALHPTLPATFIVAAGGATQPTSPLAAAVSRPLPHRHCCCRRTCAPATRSAAATSAPSPRDGATGAGCQRGGRPSCSCAVHVRSCRLPDAQRASCVQPAGAGIPGAAIVLPPRSGVQQLLPLQQGTNHPPTQHVAAPSAEPPAAQPEAAPFSAAVANDGRPRRHQACDSGDSSDGDGRCLRTEFLTLEQAAAVETAIGAVREAAPKEMRELIMTCPLSAASRLDTINWAYLCSPIGAPGTRLHMPLLVSWPAAHLP